MALTTIDRLDTASPLSRLAPNTPSANSADHNHRWPDPATRSGSHHQTPLTTGAAPGQRPLVTFPVGPHLCGLCQIVAGAYECVHGHLQWIRRTRAGGRR